MSEQKPVLDACCGGRMCWFDKAHPLVLYVDIRTASKGHISLRPNHEIAPDDVQDFRNLPYDNERFSLVLFDPPHMLKRNGSEGVLAKKYGSLDRSSWRDDLTGGFNECWRVLRPNGVLIFKWSSSEIALREVLKCFPTSPLFGHTTGSKSSTHWLCFFKEVEG